MKYIYYCVIPSKHLKNIYLLRRFEERDDVYREAEINIKETTIKMSTIYPIKEETKIKYLKIVRDFIKKGQPIGIIYTEKDGKFRAHKAFSSL